MSKIDNADIRSPPDSPLQPAIKGGDDGQSIDEINLEDPCSGLEIVEQSKLDHFNAILKEAQRVAVKAEREKSRKRPKTYDGKSKRTLKRHKKHREDLARQGYLPVFDFIARMKEMSNQRTWMEQMAATALESEDSEEAEVAEDVPNLEKSASDEFEVVDLTMSDSEHQVRCRNSLMHRSMNNSPARLPAHNP